MRQHRQDIVGMIHCTGGGQAKCRDFGKGLRYVKDNLFPMPAIFEAIRSFREIEEHEMYQVFNMGHRLELYCEESVAGSLIGIAQSHGVDAQVVGYVERNPDSDVNEVMIRAHSQEYLYR